MTHEPPMCDDTAQSTTGARADDVRTHERAQYATPPNLPTYLTHQPKSFNSPSIHTSSTSTRDSRPDMDGSPPAPEPGIWCAHCGKPLRPGDLLCDHRGEPAPLRCQAPGCDGEHDAEVTIRGDEPVAPARIVSTSPIDLVGAGGPVEAPECGMATVTAGGQSMTGCRLLRGHDGQHSAEWSR